MDKLIRHRQFKLSYWQPETASLVRRYIAEIIEMADRDVLDSARSRSVEQEVLDLVDGQLKLTPVDVQRQRFNTAQD